MIDTRKRAEALGRDERRSVSYLARALLPRGTGAFGRESPLNDLRDAARSDTGQKTREKIRQQ